MSFHLRLVFVFALSVALCGGHTWGQDTTTSSGNPDALGSEPVNDAVEIDGWGSAVTSDRRSKISLKDDDTETLLILAMGPDQDLSSERGKMNAPRVMRSIEGDFVATVRISGPVKPGDKTVAERTGFSGAGFLLMADEKNYVRLERAALVRSGKRSPYVIWEVRQNGRIRRFGVPRDYPRTIDEEKPFWLRLRRDGNQLRGFATQDPTDWHELSTKTVDLPAEISFGVAAVNVSKYPFGPVFSKLEIASVK